MLHPGWGHGATDSVSAASDAAVQGLAGSYGWIGFGRNGGDEFAVDLTPGPAGYFEPVILVDREQSIGAELVADSLTDFVLVRVRVIDRFRSGSGGLRVTPAWPSGLRGNRRSERR